MDPDGKDAKNRVNRTVNYNGKEYKQETGRLRYENTPEALKYMDCSEYVSRVLADDGLITGNTSLNSTQIAELVSNEEHYSKSDTPKEGDIAVWEGHVGIVTSVNENGDFKLSHASGNGKLSTENRHYTSAKKYRNSPFLGFYHPRDEERFSGEPPYALVVDTRKPIIKIPLPKHVQSK